MLTTPPVRNGIDNLADYAHLLQNRRLGLLTNPSGVSRGLRSTLDILAENFRLLAIFGPEHGVRGTLQNGVSITDEVDVATGVPVYSLYGRKRNISPEQAAELDAVVYDIQDIGARPFSFLGNITRLIEDCLTYDKELIILDRINPIGGAVEGIMPEAKTLNIGFGYDVPWRFGITIGEYARWVNQRHRGGRCRLTVVPCSGWQRRMYASDCGLQWINPTPNIPNEIAALIYAGFCMFGQTNVSEARGTTRPYEMYGAPYIDGPALARQMNALALPGVHFRECAFVAEYNAFRKYIGELCFGVQLHITNKYAFNSFVTGMRLIEAIRDKYPEFAIPFDNGRCEAGMFDGVLGSDAWRTGTESTDDFIRRGEHEAARFKKAVKPYLLYDDFSA